MIDKQSPIPIYFQLEELIKEQIQSGTLKAGDAIPSEREFAERYEISRMTVRQAINNLVSEGFLNRQKGRGTFVNPRKVEQELYGLTGFTEDMLERGMTPSNKLLSFQAIQADPQVAQQLQLPEGSLVYEIWRVRLADDLPMAMETTYVPVHLAKDLTEEILNESLYKYIEANLSLKISEATQQIEAASATDMEAEHLQIEKGSPVLLMLRTAYLQDGSPFEYVKSAYRADRYKFIHNMKRTN